jgi:CRP-like cAMP-binding protein
MSKVKYPHVLEFYNSELGLELTETDWLELESVAFEREIPKKDFLCQANEDFQYISILLDGLFRIYFINEDGRQFTKQFHRPYEVVAPYSEILQYIPTRSYIEALQDSKVMIIKYTDFLYLQEKNPAWTKAMIHILQHFYIDKEQREYELLMLSAEERYNQFKQKYPTLIGEVPQHYIASYLGITHISLSRLLGKQKNK